MKKIPFVKMHGLGNNFVIIEELALSDIKKDMNTFIKKITCTDTGIGCDQLITYRRSNNFLMLNIFNHDASEAEMCGNAFRCLSRMMFDMYGIKILTIKVKNKEIKAEYFDPNNIKVNMGTAIFCPTWMPTEKNILMLTKRYELSLSEIVCVDIGNPHIIIFSKLEFKKKASLSKILHKSKLFTQGINVNFVQIINCNLILEVWERGSGLTAACGSGAAASFAAANRLGLVNNKAEVTFKVGSLKVNKNKNNQIFINGPASYIFSGEYIYE